MNTARKKSITLYDKKNSDLRKKIIDYTMLQSQPQGQKEPLFKVTYDDPSTARTSQSKQVEDRNMKFKLDRLQSSLQEFLSDLRSARQDNRHIVQLTALLKQNLIYQDLYARKNDLDLKIQGFFNQIRTATITSQSRYNEIYGQCGQLWERTEELRQNVFNIRMRVQRLQEKMGFKEAYHSNNL